MYRIVSVTPIKLNNERLPGKNTMTLGNKPLISYIQESLLASSYINERYVYCSDPTIQDYLLPGVYYRKRNKSLDLPTSNFTKIFAEFMEDVDADIYIYAHATAPFVSVETIDQCIQKVANEEYDSAFCAVKIQDFLWQHGEPLNFDPTNVPRSQDLEPIYRETSGVYVFKKNVFTQYKRRIGLKPYIREMSFEESIDINTAEDFKLAEMIIRNNGGKNE